MVPDEITKHNYVIKNAFVFYGGRVEISSKNMICLPLFEVYFVAPSDFFVLIAPMSSIMLTN